MLQEHPTLRTSTDAGYWYEWLRNLYAHYIVMAVRRELDRRSDGPNLCRLLRQIAQRPSVLSGKRYLDMFQDRQIARERGSREFTELAGTRAFIDSAIVKGDLNELDKQARLVIRYANKIVAHRTQAQVAVTMRHVNSSLEAIEELLKKYHVLLTGKSLHAAEPSVLVTWMTAFQVPWISR